MVKRKRNMLHQAKSFFNKYVNIESPGQSAYPYKLMMIVWCFMLRSTLSKSYRNDGRVIIKSCAMKRRKVMGSIPPPVEFELGTS